MIKKDNRITLYNILLPVWLLFFWPSLLWLFLIPANYLIDRIILKWSLGDLPEKGLFCRKNTWKICLAGFLGDFFGFLLLFAVFMLSGTANDDSSLGSFLGELGYGIGFNPFSHIVSFALVLLSVIIASAAIFLLDGRILRKAGLSADLSRKCALRLSLLTAPYLYFFPSAVIYGSNFFYL